MLRADAREAGMLAGSDVSTADEAAKVAADPRQAARLAVAAAGATISHPGGRPALTPQAIQDQLALLA